MVPRNEAREERRGERKIERATCAFRKKEHAERERKEKIGRD